MWPYNFHQNDSTFFTVALNHWTVQTNVIQQH